MIQDFLLRSQIQFPSTEVKSLSKSRLISASAVNVAPVTNLPFLQPASCTINT